MPTFALPSVFRAAAIDGVGDPWISDALHLRVRLWPEIGFPLHPFTAWRASAEAVEVAVHWTTHDGQTVNPPFDPGRHDGGVIGSIIGPVKAPLTTPEWCWLQVEASAFDDDFRIEVLDRIQMPTGAPRVLASRHREPFEFGGDGMSRILARGTGEIGRVWGVHAEAVGLGWLDSEPAHSFGLPIPSVQPWFAGFPDPDDRVKERLFYGAAKCLGPPDQPGGPFDTLDPDQEVSRILDVVAPEMIDEWLDFAYADPSDPPLHRRRTDGETQPNGARAEASLRAIDALTTMSVDPDIARYLGLASALDPGMAELAAGPNIWLIASQWFVQPERLVGPRRRRKRLRTWLDAAPAPVYVPGILDSQWPEAPELKDRIRDFNSRLVDPGQAWEPFSLVAIAVAAGESPPDPPERLEPSFREPGRWNPNTEGTLWTQPITLTGRAAEGPIALARVTPGELTTLHRMNSDGRAATLLAPWSSKTDRVKTDVGVVPIPRERVLTDVAVPTDPGGATWWLSQADQWGRWSDNSEENPPQPEPARPDPPPPVIDGWFVEAEAVAVMGLRSPGIIRLRVSTPPPHELGPGSRPIATLTLWSTDIVSWDMGGTVTAGSSLTFSATGVDAGTPAVVEGTIRDFEPGGATTIVITATAADTDGRVSKPGLENGIPIGPGVLRRAVYDPRPATSVPTAPRLIWAGPPDGTGTAEVEISWPTQPIQASYRVYMSSEHRLAEALAIPPAEIDPSLPRAVRAQTVWQRERVVKLDDKAHFTLLTEQPVPRSGVTVSYKVQLPSMASGVQFLRIVPLSYGGQEAPFRECGLIPIAIPSIDRPPAPRLRAVATDEGTVDLHVDAPGVEVPTGGGPPRYRIRRTRRDLTDPVFAPVVLEGQLVANADGWSALVHEGTETPLPRYVRHTWFVEVALPPEPDLAPGTTPVPNTADGAWEFSRGEAASAWSAPSLPASTVVVDPDPPSTPEVLATENPDGTVTLTIPDPPVAHPRATAPYRAAIFRGSGNAAWAPLPLQPITSVPFTFSDVAPTGRHRVAIVDPLGRMGEAVLVQPL
jgi:hypothetical protein